MKTLQSIAFLISMSITTFAQISNWRGEASFKYCCNYDFDFNRPTGARISKQTSFIVDIHSNGSGKFIFLDNEYGDKYVHNIQSAEFSNYTDGTDFIKLTCSNQYGTSRMNVNLQKKKRGKVVISKIAIINSSNAGSIYFN